MSIGLKEPSDLIAIDGIRLATARAGLYKTVRDDLTLIEISESSTASAVFTRNQFCAAPVRLARAHLDTCSPRLCLINAGNANAGTGSAGINDAIDCCRELSDRKKIRLEEVLPFSTGVIGERLPVEKIIKTIPSCLETLSEDNWLNGAKAIMTTDTIAKGISKKITINGRQINITGIAKGSGMIRPDMATMLAFIGTDALIDQGILDSLLRDIVNKSFNRITVDGDTSTNDACLLIATGKSQVEITTQDEQGFAAFEVAMTGVMQDLARSIIRDGEGISKFVTVDVNGGNNSQECLKVAYNIAHSPLVKTAIFASDPNWGRILAAIGRTDIPALNVEQIDIQLNQVFIVKQGEIDINYSEEKGQQAMNSDELVITVNLHRGDASEKIWTTDLSYEYVKINAEYRT